MKITKIPKGTQDILPQNQPRYIEGFACKTFRNTIMVKSGTPIFEHYISRFSSGIRQTLWPVKQDLWQGDPYMLRPKRLWCSYENKLLLLKVKSPVKVYIWVLCSAMSGLRLASLALSLTQIEQSVLAPTPCYRCRNDCHGGSIFQGYWHYQCQLGA